MLKIDLHTHSIASGHALNTVFEMASFAYQNGITHLGITDHGPSMKGASHYDYFWISNQLTELYGVKLYLGIEANILDETGLIDFSGELLERQNIVSAGLHSLTPYKSKGIEYNTKAIINAMKNPFVKIITHPFRSDFPVNLKEVFFESIKSNTFLEINNNLFSQKELVSELISPYKELISLCKQYKRKIIIGSDAHVATRIGVESSIDVVAKELGLIPEIILNNFADELFQFLAK